MLFIGPHPRDLPQPSDTVMVLLMFGMILTDPRMSELLRLSLALTFDL